MGHNAMMTHAPQTENTGNDDPELIELIGELRAKYGELIEVPDLAPLLGYQTVAALSQTVYRGVCPVPTVKIKGRRSRVAHVEDVAEHILSVRREARQHFKRPRMEGTHQ